MPSARRVSALDPALRIILISGYAGQEAAAGVAFLEKPFSAASFRAAVREQLAGRGPEGPPPPGSRKAPGAP